MNEWRKNMTVTLIDVGYALWFIFPAYCANAVPVIFGGGRPIDFGKIFLDGKPILGSHKTLRGFFSGLLVGTLVGFLQTLLFQQVLSQYYAQFQYDVFVGIGVEAQRLTYRGHYNRYLKLHYDSRECANNYDSLYNYGIAGA